MDLSRVESLKITFSILGVENVNAFIYTYSRWMACVAVIVFGVGGADTRNRANKNVLFFILLT